MIFTEKKRRTGQFWAFVVGLSIPFANLQVSSVGLGWSLGLVSIAFYFYYMLPFLKAYKQLIKRYGRIILFPIYFLIVLTIVNILNINPSYTTPIVYSSMINCLLFYYILLLHGIFDSKAIMWSLYGIGAGALLMGAFFLAQFNVEIDDGGRLTMFGENANNLGVYMVMGTVIILYSFILKNSFNLGSYRYGMIALLVPLIILLVMTASRTAMLSLILSIIVIVVMYPYKNTGKRLLSYTFCTLFILYGLSKVVTSDLLIVERLIATKETGATSGRDKIVSNIMPYIYDNFIIGVGQTGYVEVADKALGKVHEDGQNEYGFSPHNVIVEVLIYTGVVGSFFMFVFWFHEFKAVWMIFKEKKDILPLLMAIPVFAYLISAQLLSQKWGYVLFAYFLIEKLNINRNEKRKYNKQNSQVPQESA